MLFRSIQPGDKYLGLFNISASGDAFEIVSRNGATGKETSLSMTRDNRTFNWADVTLEAYNVQSCDQFAAGPMVFDDLKLWDTKLRPIEPQQEPTPAGDNAWLLTSAKPCGGTIAPGGGADVGRSFSIEYGGAAAAAPAGSVTNSAAARPPRAAVATASSGQCETHDGFDCTEDNIGKQPASSASECCQLCQQHAGCQAYTYGYGSFCYFKKECGDMRSEERRGGNEGG